MNYNTIEIVKPTLFNLNSSETFANLKVGLLYNARLFYIH